jgi:hypothetical protein
MHHGKIQLKPFRAKQSRKEVAKQEYGDHNGKRNHDASLSNFFATLEKCEYQGHGDQTQANHGRYPNRKIHDSCSTLASWRVERH